MRKRVPHAARHHSSVFKARRRQLSRQRTGRPQVVGSHALGAAANMTAYSYSCECLPCRSPGRSFTDLGCAGTQAAFSFLLAD